MVSNYRLKWGRRGFRTTAFNEPKSPDEEAPAAARNTEIGAGSPTPPEGLAFFFTSSFGFGLVEPLLDGDNEPDQAPL